MRGRGPTLQQVGDDVGSRHPFWQRHADKPRINKDGDAIRRDQPRHFIRSMKLFVAPKVDDVVEVGRRKQSHAHAMIDRFQ